MSCCDKAEPLAGRYQQLLPDQIGAGDHLGHAVLDLKPGVHLDEVEPIVLVDEELDGSGARVPDRLRQRDRRLRHRLTRRGVERRRGRLLDQLLAAPLKRTLALVQVDHVAPMVADHLDLHVTHLFEQLLM